VRSYYHWITSKERTHRVLIYGAGSAVSQLLASLSNDHEMQVVGLVDDDPKLAGTTLAGMMVYPVGSVTDAQLMLKVFANHQVQTVYHAAAYKHVPMVEHNPFAGICNNAWGTRTAADAAVKAGVERFILISIDKAVRPTKKFIASLT